MEAVTDFLRGFEQYGMTENPCSSVLECCVRAPNRSTFAVDFVGSGPGRGLVDFTNWASEVLTRLNDLVHQFVVALRREHRVRAWSRWFR